MKTGSGLPQDPQSGVAALATGVKDSSSQGPACTRCRQQKLKCSKTKPVCKRCANLSRSCSYPDPPNRRRLLKQRRRNLAWDRAQPGLTINSGTTRSAFLAPEQNLLPVNHDDLFPSSEVAMFLIEVYFSRAYNAALIYHKQQFVSDWIAGKLQSFVALSVFATASVFLQNDRASQLFSPFAESIHNLNVRGAEWAARASQLVLAQADLPNLKTAQACQTLALYWFAFGETKRVHFHVSVAYRVCRLLGIHQDSHPVDDPTTAELRRRCLWACWITQCISQENASFKTSCWDEVEGLPLPSDEASYLTNDPHPSQCLTNTGEVEKLLQTTVEPRKAISFMSELAKLTGIWWEIHDFLKKLSAAEPTEYGQCLESWMDIASRLEKIEDALPILYRQQPPLSFDSEIGTEQLFSLLCLRHACACVLYASVVPLYAPSTSLKIPKLITRAAAQEVLKHASLTLDLANKLDRYQPDRSKISALAGYCLYFCIYVQQKYYSTENAAQQPIQDHEGAMSILWTLQEYWRPLRGLVVKLLEQRKHQVARLQHLEKSGTAQVHDLESELSNTLPEVKKYISEETTVSNTPHRRNSSYTSSAGFNQRASPVQPSDNSERDTLTFATARAQIGMTESVIPTRAAGTVLQGASDDDFSHSSDLMGAWWEIGQDLNDINMFSIFDMDIMNNAF